jgi:nucleotide-binding universal stress UspA family protein
MIKTILILADETLAFETAMVSAVELGRQFGAHLDVLHVRSDPLTYLPLAGGGLSALVIEEVKKRTEMVLSERERKARAAYDRCLTETGVSASWRVAIGGKPEIAAAAARLRDLVLLSRPDNADEASCKNTLEAVLFDGGSPVLLLAPKSLQIIGPKAAVGWNGSSQAARAVAAAIPFLQRATRTTILSAGAVDTYASPEGLVTRLARHDIKSDATEFEPRNRSIGVALLDHCHKAHTSLLVTGAYGHGRLREMILGSVTRDILSMAELPVLMAH